MYGMVNNAVEQLIIAEHGEACWDRVRSLAGVEDEVFVSNQSYPDKITYDLMMAASQVLEVPAENILIRFGEWWVLKTAQEGYGALIKATGTNLKDFLLNMPNFHTRVKMMLPDLSPPSFTCFEKSDTSVELHYMSKREGLAPFVKGLLSGLAQMFNTTAEVEHVAQKTCGDDHDIFLVKWS